MDVKLSSPSGFAAPVVMMAASKTRGKSQHMSGVRGHAQNSSGTGLICINISAQGQKPNGAFAVPPPSFAEITPSSGKYSDVY